MSLDIVSDTSETLVVTHRNVFGIAFDIDGVFIRGSEIIGRGPEALRRLYKDVEKGNDDELQP